ncbi:MAG: 50S ribosomal protein L3 [Acidobacteria bacterium RBG_16_70_10]|nr:MAG: 50S ribosomal protein L3 [Acidobacteria bacterium RBG_16_70_10]
MRNRVHEAAKMSVQGIIGRKVGMTQVYAEDGRAFPVTVIEAGPCVVVQRKSREKDGYVAVQLGLVERRAAKRVTRPMKGHFEKAGLPPCRVLREFRLEAGAEMKIGDRVSVSLFAPGDTVRVTGVSKGKGFQGVVKRHHFRGGAATHGSMFHRAPGSIGASAFPSRVLKGMRAAGHMGQDRVTVRNLEVVRVDSGNNLLVVRGAVPGAGGSYLVIRKS